MLITEENCKQLLWKYAYENYSDEFEDAVDECPYPYDDLDDDFAFKEVMEWFVLERVQPTTGKTILREFVEKFVSNPNLKMKMLQMGEVFSGEFTIEDIRGNHAILMNSEDGKRYTVKIFEQIKHSFKVGRTLIGRIHPWGDIYRTAGIIRFKLNEEERMPRLGLVTPKMIKNWYEKDMTKKAESIVIYENSSISSIVNKYPFQWVDGICLALGIDTKFRKNEKAKMIHKKLKSDIQSVLEHMSEKSLEVLAFVLKKGGIVKYNQLSKRFNDEIGFWWNEHPQVSDVGMARNFGLLYVGKKAFGDRLYKVALVPVELRETLKKALTKEGIKCE